MSDDAQIQTTFGGHTAEEVAERRERCGLLSDIMQAIVCDCLNDATARVNRAEVADHG